MTLSLYHKQCNPSSVQHGYIQLRGAAQRSGASCLARRFAVLCHAALYVFLSLRQQLLVVVVVPGMIQIPGLFTCFVYSSFCFIWLIVLSRSPCPSPPANIAPTDVQHVTSTSTQYREGQLALHKYLLALQSIPH